MLRIENIAAIIFAPVLMGAYFMFTVPAYSQSAFNLDSQADMYCDSIANKAAGDSELYDQCITDYQNKINSLCDPGSMSVTECQSLVEDALDQQYATAGESSGSSAEGDPASTGGSVSLEPIKYEGNFKQCGQDVNNDPIYVSIGVDCPEGENPIIAYLVATINFLSGIVVVVVTIMVAVAGVQYITSRGRPDQIEIAKKKLTNALIALGTYIMLYAILQWIIPGGALAG